MSLEPRIIALRPLAHWLAALQRVFQAEGYTALYIGGGSAREILDHLHHREPLAMRDLDLYLLRGRRAEIADLRRVVGRLVDQGLVAGGAMRVRRKIRANPALPLPARDRHVIGYGVHLVAPGLPILSLGVLHGLGDLALNGLFDVDTINLRLGITDRLGEDPVSVLDPHGGYAAWRAHAPQVVHWAEVQRCYIRHGLRIARCFGRAGHERLSPAFLALHRAHRPEERRGIDSQRELHRDLLKLLSDAHFASALRMLGALAVLDEVLPVLQARLCAPAPFPDPPGLSGAARALARAEALLAPLPDPRAQRMLAKLAAVAPSVFHA